jgi:hypothetical protein
MPRRDVKALSRSALTELGPAWSEISGSGHQHRMRPGPTIEPAHWCPIKDDRGLRMVNYAGDDKGP